MNGVMKKIFFSIFAAVMTMNIAVLSATATGDSGNLIGNGGFETELGNETDWRFMTADNWEYSIGSENTNRDVSISESEFYKGIHAVSLSGKDALVAQHVTLEQGETYLIEAYTKGSAGSVKLVKAANNIWADQDKNIIVSENIQSETDWTKVAFTYTVPDNGPTSCALVFKDDGIFGTKLYVDGVTMRKLIPATVTYDDSEKFEESEDYTGSATAVRFTVTPGDTAIKSIRVVYGNNTKEIDSPVLSGDSSAVFGIIVEDILDVNADNFKDEFQIEVN